MNADSRAVSQVLLAFVSTPVLVAAGAVVVLALAFLVWKKRRSGAGEVDACRTEVATLFAGGKRDIEAIATRLRGRLAAWKAEENGGVLVATALAELAKQTRDAQAYETYGLAGASPDVKADADDRKIVDLQKAFGLCVEFGGWADPSTIDLLQRLMRLQAAAGKHEDQIRILERACVEGMPHFPPEIAKQVRQELEYAVVLRTAKLKASARTAGGH